MILKHFSRVISLLFISLFSANAFAAFGAAGKAQKIVSLSLETMTQRYLSGTLAPKIT